MNVWSSGTTLKLEPNDIGFVCIMSGAPLASQMRESFEKKIPFTADRAAVGIPTSPFDPRNQIPMFDTSFIGCGSFTFTTLRLSPWFDILDRQRALRVGLEDVVLQPTIHHGEVDQYEGFVVSMRSAENMWSFSGSRNRNVFQNQVSGLIRTAFPGAR